MVFVAIMKKLALYLHDVQLSLLFILGVRQHFLFKPVASTQTYLMRP